MMGPGFSATRRHLPHWTLPGSTYFLTFHLITGKLAEDERRIVLDQVKSGDGRFYDLAAASVMPDHVHLILKPRDGYTLSQILKGIKGVSARRLNQKRNAQESIWQDESWDRIVRDADEYDEEGPVYV